MDWSTVIVAGVAALVGVVVAFVADRRRSQARRRILSSPPQRTSLESLAAPEYLSSDQVRSLRQTERAARLPDDGALRHPPVTSDQPELAAGWASADFINDPVARRAVMWDPMVLMVETVTRWQYLPPVIRTALDADRALVVVASSIDESIVTTLGLNAVAGRLRCLCVLTDQVADVPRLVGGEVVSSADLAADYVPATSWGRCEAWVADSDHSWIVGGFGTQPQPNSSSRSSSMPKK
ncbi:MAG: hypothetical protein LBV06_00765 [Propionibacteriaceae bacterium]|jgi:hypothetical protein|nr:hypothetical protein [Propionibacteriaceae bacterium]